MKRYIKSSSKDICCVIRTNDWYDPEGLGIEDKGKEMFCGSYDDCLIWLTDEYAKCERSDNCIVEKYIPGQEMKIYCPNAICNLYYTIVDK